MREGLRLRRKGIRPFWCWHCGFIFWEFRPRWRGIVHRCGWCKMEMR